MPELPEVETIRRDLAEVAIGRRITSLTLDGHRTVRRQDPQTTVDGVTATVILAVRRSGKFLLLDLVPNPSNGEFGTHTDTDAPLLDGLGGQRTLVVHLRMSGQLRWMADGDAPLLKHTHARIRFDDGEELRFVDPRTFGELWVTSPRRS